jgi:uncharacterized protein
VLPSRERAIEILKQNRCPQSVINHCIAVTDFALQITHKLQERGLTVDLQLVEVGAILHDLGRSKSHGVDHSLLGAQMAQDLGLSKPVINIIKRHVGAGITNEEAAALGWPEDVYIPQTLEEKVVCYADKRINHDEVVPIEEEVKKLQKQGFAAGVEKVRNLHYEITKLLGETS